MPIPSQPSRSRGILWVVAAIFAVLIIGVIIAALTLSNSVDTAGSSTETTVAQESSLVSTSPEQSSDPGPTGTAPVSTTSTSSSAPGTTGPLVTTTDTDSPSTTSSAPPQGVTEIRRVTPVTRQGEIRAGWTAGNTTEEMDMNCVPSLVALDADVYRCGPNAFAGQACFASAEAGVFHCPISPFYQEFRTYTFTGDISSAPVADPMPWGMTLDDARQCIARQGGAWGWRADDYVPVYSCTSGTEFVLAASDRPVVDRSREKWTVLMGEVGQGEEYPAPQPVGVAVAYYAGWVD